MTLPLRFEGLFQFMTSFSLPLYAIVGVVPPAGSCAAGGSCTDALVPDRQGIGMSHRPPIYRHQPRP